MVDFSPSNEDRLILEAVEALSARLGPRAEGWDRADRIDPEALAAVAELGLCGLFVDEAAGGAGLGCTTAALTTEALARASGALALRLSAHAAGALPALVAAGRTQADLAPLVAGERWAAKIDGVALTEGRLRGQARWVVGGADAEILVVLTRCGRVARVDGAAAGLTREVADGLGMRGSGLAHLRLEDVLAGEVTGPLDPGTRDRLAEVERLAVASVGVGIGRAALAEAAAYARERRQFGRPIADFQAVQWMLADAATEMDAAALLTIRAGLSLDGADDLGASHAAAAALVLTSEAALSASQKAIQVHGGYGFVREFVVERLARDARYLGVALGGRDAARAALGRALLDGEPEGS